MTIFLDAIKKIILESELGKSAKLGVIQNRKLRREVTTISRMTHKNIVRYYQAWVEGGGRDADVIEEEEDNHDDLPDAGEVLASEDAQSDDGNDDSKGWWTNSPDDRGVTLATQDRSLDSTSDSSSESGDSSTSWSDMGDDNSTEGKNDFETDNSRGINSKKDKYRRTPSSLSDLLENENNHCFGVSNRHNKFPSKNFSPIASRHSHVEPVALWIRTWQSNV